MGDVKYKIVGPPKEEPISLEDAKAHLRLIPGDTTEDEAIILPLIQAAREYCENVTGRAFAQQTVAAYPAADQQIVRLPMPPALRVEEVTVYPKDGTEKTLDPSAYVLDDVTGTLFLTERLEGLREINPIQITYTAGYEKIPSSVRQAMLLLIGHWYENRETVVVGAIASIEVQKTANVILNQYKVWWF